MIDDRTGLVPSVDFGCFLHHLLYLLLHIRHSQLD